MPLSNIEVVGLNLYFGGINLKYYPQFSEGVTLTLNLTLLSEA